MKIIISFEEKIKIKKLQGKWYKMKKMNEANNKYRRYNKLKTNDQW